MPVQLKNPLEGLNNLFQRWEEQLLSRIEDFCLERLLGHLWVPPMHEQIEKALLRANSELTDQLVAALRRKTIEPSPEP